MVRSKTMNSPADNSVAKFQNKLMNAVKSGNLEKVEEEVVKEHNLHIPDAVLDMATKKKNEEIVHYLLDINKQFPKFINNGFISAARWGKLKLVESIAKEHHVDVNARDKYNYTAMDYAIQQNYSNILEYLLNTRKYSRSYINQGFLSAVCQGNLAFVKCFVDQYGADVNAGDKNDTAVKWAIENKNTKIVEYLLNTKKLNTKSINLGLFSAIHKCDVKLVNCLVEVHGADVNAININCQTAFECAIHKRYTHIAKYFLYTNKLSSESINRGLIRAVNVRNFKFVKLLVEQHKADLDATNKNNQGPLEFAIQQNRPDIVEYLLNAENLRTETLNRGLRWAARTGNLEIAKMLVQKHADVDARDEHNKTVLDLAKERKHTQLIKYLTEL